MVLASEGGHFFHNPHVDVFLHLPLIWRLLVNFSNPTFNDTSPYLNLLIHSVTILDRTG